MEKSRKKNVGESYLSNALKLKNKKRFCSSNNLTRKALSIVMIRRKKNTLIFQGAVETIKFKGKKGKAIRNVERKIPTRKYI